MRRSRLLPLVALAAWPACQGWSTRAPYVPPPVVCPVLPTGPLLTGVSSLHAGGAITCAVVAGRVACWGIGDKGRLGDGFEANRAAPVFIPGLEGVAEVTRGNDATFARLQDGSVVVWGSNRGGEFADGSADHHIAWTPRKLPSWGSVRQIRGGIPTCALRQDGKVECAGHPRFRGIDNIDPSGKAPRVIPGLDAIVGIAAGSGFSCALRRDGLVLCWGMDDDGQLGDGGGDDSDEPVRVRGISSAVEIAAGGDTACARLAEGGVVCWGSAFGEYEDRERLAWTSPVSIDGTDEATQLSVGDRVGCVLVRGGSVRCWGEPSYDGQLGDGSAKNRPRTASPVACVEGAVQVSVGDNHSCALLGDGTARCWGSGPYGAIGDGTREARPVPVAVLAAVPADPPPDRCPAGTTFRRGSGEDKPEASVELCERPDGKREGHFVGRWPSGGVFQEGAYEAGVRHGPWKRYYEHGHLLSEERYEHGEPQGLWIAYSIRYIFAFATCFDRGKRLWQVTDEREARTRPCP